MLKYIYCDVASEKQWRKATAEDKKLARQIYKKCSKSTQKKLTFTVTHPAIVMNALQVIYFPYDDNNGKTWWSNDGKEVEISIKQFNLLVTRNTVAKNELIRIKKYLQLNKLSPRDKIRAIHDYICEDVEYDFSYKHTTLYDALFAKTVVCIGYSIVFKALCDQCDLLCDIVSNDTHAWNRVMLDNEWHYLDATWDDYTKSEKYYLKTDKEFYAVHPKHINIDKDVFMK